jgi:hypothetical protein
MTHAIIEICVYYVDGGGHILKRESVKIVAPIYNPDKVLCIGMNYVDHCQEQNAPVPEVPVIFNKFPSCIIFYFTIQSKKYKLNITELALHCTKQFMYIWNHHICIG